MDQIKIGKFIASIRKEKGLTQLELANKLSITDRAISKWENGRGLPDLSLIKPLCDELGITVNELLVGERICVDEINIKADENLINTLTFSEKRIKKTKGVLIAVLVSVFLFFTILFICFSIDVYRMKNDLPVVFSTWGYDYTPPINFNDDLVELAVKKYVVSHDDEEHKYDDNEKSFVAFKTYLIEEIEKESKYNLYAWVCGESLYIENDEIKSSSAYSIPHKFVVEKINDLYVVIDSRTPRDGGYYSEDMKNIFPAFVRKEMQKVHSDGTLERLKMEILEQAKLYFHIN